MKYSVLAFGGALLACGVADADSSRISSISKVIVQPDPQLARPMNREPTPEEISRLERVVGCTPEEVIRRFGHPSRVKESTRFEMTERWVYPWGDPKNPTENVAQIHFRSGKVVHAGYHEEERQTGFSVPTNYFSQ